MMLVDEYTVTISTTEYEALVESQTKLRIFERLARREQSAYLDLTAVLAVLGIEREEKGDSE